MVLPLAGLPLWTAGSLAAETEYYSAAGTANAFLEIGVGARAAAMGEAYTALGRDVSSLYWNPAGLAFLRGPQFMLMHNQWFQDTTYEYGAAAFPSPAGVLGFSAAVLQYGTLQRLDDSGQPQGYFTAMDVVATGAYALALSPDFSLGAALKIPLSVLDTDVQAAAALDVGLQAEPFQGWRVGLVATNLGTAVGEASQPATLKAGAAYNGWLPELTVGLDVGRRLFEETYDIKAGAEYAIEGILAPRVGYSYTTGPGNLGGLSGLSAGVGLRIPFDGFALSVDYAFVPYGDLGSTHRVAMTLALDGPPPAAKPPAPLMRRTEAAKTGDVKVFPARNVRLSQVGRRIRLKWSASPTPGRQGYHIYLKVDRGDYRRLTSKPLRAGAYTSKLLARGHRYTFIVKTVGPDGTESRGNQALSLRLN